MVRLPVPIGVGRARAMPWPVRIAPPVLLGGCYHTPTRRRQAGPMCDPTLLRRMADGSTAVFQFHVGGPCQAFQMFWRGWSPARSGSPVASAAAAVGAIGIPQASASAAVAVTAP